MRCLYRKPPLSVRGLLMVALVVLGTDSVVRGATIYESGTLGPTGQSSGTVPATNVSANVFTGARFELTEPVLTTQVGGHFFGTGDFFGAIVALDGENDFPDSGDLSTNDVLGIADLTFPALSDEVFGDVDVSLNPGWYALVFGSGLFDTSGNGAATRNNTDIDDPVYLGYQPGRGWFNLIDLSDAIQFVDHRFVLSGDVVPEPQSIVVLALGVCLFLIQRFRTM